MNLSAKLAPVAVTAYQCLSAGGEDIEALYCRLLSNQTGLRPLQLFALPFATLVGEITGSLPAPRADLHAYDCRNARLALKALQQNDFRQHVERAKTQYGAVRVGLILGTSTSGIYETENAYGPYLRDGVMPTGFELLKTHTAQATAEYLQLELGLKGPCYAISTACSSSAKALGVGQRLIGADVCDAVLVAGVDSLCRLTLRGFNSLQLIAGHACRPMDEHRGGINIGEGAALLLLERQGAHTADKPKLLAVGESSDAHHMSAPHPEGAGAAAAMAQALQLGGCSLHQVDYLNLHATASQLNDAAEAKAVVRLFGDRPPPCSGVKGLLGHTLGAAGAVEVVVSLLALDKGFLPGTCGLETVDPQFGLDVLHEPLQDCQPRRVLSNAFGFGGNNASVLLEAA